MFPQKIRPGITKLGAISYYGLMILLALIFALPIVYMLVSSLKPYPQLLYDTSSIRAFLPVGDLSLENYEFAFRQAPVARFLFNSVLIATVTVAGGLFVNSMAGFALSRMKWKGQGIVIAVILATIIIPFEAVAIPLLMVVNNLPWIGADGLTVGWFNSYHVQIIPFLANSFSIFLFFQFFKRIPGELIDAARIDGANWFQVFAKVIVPLSGPVFATAAIIRFLAMWNQYLWPTMVIQTDKYRTLMVGHGYFGGRDGASMAYLTVATVPVLILFFLFQRSFINSVTSQSFQE
ncbi:MAG: carbohydrate ABC transporter permease [Chloroflexota bacterium]|nr:MAG: carbohydrate ABC transporter permease [Chloroflexota bacterium]